MAINIDTVYQRVLALANKEQRGYINPQQFNLFANQSQFDIFEDYFFKLAGLEFSQKNNSQYNDMKKLLDEKIQPFEKIIQDVVVLNEYGQCTLPSDLYRLGEVYWFGPTGTTNYNPTTIIEEITDKELIITSNSPLAKWSMKRPVFTRSSHTSGGLTTIRIYPYNTTDPSKQVALYFTQNGDTDADTTAAVDSSGNFDFIEDGQTVTGTGIPDNTTVVSIVAGAGGLVLSNAATTTETDVTLTFASDDIKCNYIRRPEAVSWGYTEVNSVALYNSASSTNFELHESEENTLVIKILALAGIGIKDPELMQVAMAKESQTK